MLVCGAFVSFVVGLISIWVFERLLVRGHLKWFAWWCIPVGIAFFCWQLLAR
jgi:undecaprenyl pyrophosphate phosphatase UppP